MGGGNSLSLSHTHSLRARTALVPEHSQGLVSSDRCHHLVVERRRPGPLSVELAVVRRRRALREDRAARVDPALSEAEMTRDLLLVRLKRRHAGRADRDDHLFSAATHRWSWSPAIQPCTGVPPFAWPRAGWVGILLLEWLRKQCHHPAQGRTDCTSPQTVVKSAGRWVVTISWATR